MKEGWKYSTLGEVCISISDGDWIESKDQSSSGIRLIQTGNVGIGVYKNKEEKSRFITEETFTRLKCTEIFAGDILVSRLPEPVGRSCIIPCLNSRLITAVDCSILKLKKTVIQGTYLNYYMQSSSYFQKVKEQCTGTTRQRITRKKLTEIPIPLPPLPEQERIVTYLDSAFAKIDALKKNAEKMLNEAKALFAAALKEAMTPQEGWEEKKIGEVFKSYSGGTPMKSHKEFYEGGHIPWLRSGEVCQQYITETEMFITEEGLKNSSAKFYPKDTVVIAMYGATAAQVGILKIEATSNQAVCGLLPNEDYLPEYVYFWFTAIQKELAAQAQGGAQPNISQEKIKKVSIPVIDIEKQTRIVAHLDSLSAKVRQLEENYRKTATECDAMKQAILREAFE